MTHINWALVFQFAVGILTVLAGVYATRAANKGKRADTKQQEKVAQVAADQADRKQRFEEITTSLAAARADLEYYKKELDTARAERKTAETEKDRLQVEWLKRFKTLLERCEQISEQLSALLDGDIDIPAPQRKRVMTAINSMSRHVREDHNMFGEADLENNPDKE